MKKRLNIIFFSLCFLGSVIAESYFIQAEVGNTFSIIALGVVVLITGYLWMDSIRSKLSEYGKNIKSDIDQMYREDTERWNERYNELQNFLKATYTATKKNTMTGTEHMEELMNRIEALEAGNNKALQKLLELQMKSLEGQKKSLSLQINYDKENTKQLIKAIGETQNNSDTLELLNKIAETIGNNTQILQQELRNMSITVQTPAMSNQNIEDSWNTIVQPKIENLTETGWDVEAEVELDAQTDDRNGNIEPMSEQIVDPWSFVSEQEELSSGWNNEAAQSDEVTDASQAVTEDAFVWNSMNTELNNLIESWNTEPAPDASDDIPEIFDSMPEEVEAISETETEEPPIEKPEIKPLYTDPNKALSADEIAALFASFGQ